MDRGLAERYSDVILRTGVDIQPGQPLLIRTEVAHRAMAEALSRRAYELGSSHVHVMYSDKRLERARLESSAEGHLEYVPSFTQLLYRTFVEENWASVSLTGAENPDELEGLDPSRQGAVRKAAAAAARDWLAAVSSNAIRWNVCLAPTPLWAAKVLGSQRDWERRIWKLLIPILRLDREEPARAWLDHDAELKRKAGVLNSARFDHFHFRGPGTDLRVGMSRDRVFSGGRCRARDGRLFFPNLPTEEIFSTPDCTRTEGVVRCTRPVEVNGTSVEEAWFRFESGRVAAHGASRNAAALDQFLSTDEGALMIGEIALVGCDSPIYRSGRTFHSILFDENASSHIALGNGYTECVEGSAGLGEDALRALGCNVSLVHTDFMIGSEAVDVDGVDASGGRFPVMRKGMFVI